MAALFRRDGIIRDTGILYEFWQSDSATVKLPVLIINAVNNIKRTTRHLKY